MAFLPPPLPTGLCNAAALEETLSRVGANSLARLAGVTASSVQDA
jgi:hypothetical protein